MYQNKHLIKIAVSSETGDISRKLQNPRIFSIHLHTFRHWNATMEYHRTKDLLYVMKRLGNRNIQTTLI